MREEGISSSGDPLQPPGSSPPRTATPTASSAGASSPALPANVGNTDWIDQGQNSKGASLSRIGSQHMYTSVSTSAGGSALGSSHPSCRPWERGDLLRRLSTFRPVDWFGKPKAASSLACARRGWVNVDIDRIECESCGAILKSLSSTPGTPSQEADAAEEEFAMKLDEGHKFTCPWVGNCCPESLVQFPPTPPSALIGGYKDRCDGLLQFPSLPLVAASAIEQIRASRSAELDRLLQSHFAGGESAMRLDILVAIGTDNLKEDAYVTYSRALKLISLCGWEPRWLPNVQDCEENSAQSARNGCSIGPSRHLVPPRDPFRGKKAMSSSTKMFSAKSRSLSRSPLLDCSLCGATVRIWDFLSISRPAYFVPNSSDIPETSKKLALTRGISAASGINGWVPPDDIEKEQPEDPDEAATGEGKSLSNVGVDLNLTISAGLSSSRLNMNVASEQVQDVCRGQELLMPTDSDAGDRAASYESRGPSSRKRNLEEGGSTVDRPPLFLQPADSIEGTIIDRDGDEVDDGGQYSAGPSKRTRDSYFNEPRRFAKDSSGAGPSQSYGFDIANDAFKGVSFEQGPEQVMIVNPTAIDSTRVSSVIAMDTIGHGEESDSMESVENHPVDFDEINLPSTSTIKDIDPNETSELNYSNQAQQSTTPAVARSAGEMGTSSTNEEEVVNADTVTAQGKDGTSFGISGGSVGMGASHEAEIHGAIYRADSIVGEVEPVAEVTDNQGQTGENGPDPGLMGDFVPEEMDQEDPHGDSQELMSRSVGGRADSGSKIMGSAKEESVESGEKTSNVQVKTRETSPQLSLSRNAIVCSGFEVSKEEVDQAAKDVVTDDCGYADSGYMVADGTGLPNGGSNYDEVTEFDPIKNHNHFCPWVNGNVAAAGCSSTGSGSSPGALALCGWQLTLDALDAFQSQGQVPVQTVESESAASMYKDDHLAPGRKLMTRNSFNKRRGKN